MCPPSASEAQLHAQPPVIRNAELYGGGIRYLVVIGHGWKGITGLPRERESKGRQRRFPFVHFCCISNRTHSLSLSLTFASVDVQRRLKIPKWCPIRNGHPICDKLSRFASVVYCVHLLGWQRISTRTILSDDRKGLQLRQDDRTATVMSV
jgi:hypothetical protein